MSMLICEHSLGSSDLECLEGIVFFVSVLGFHKRPFFSGQKMFPGDSVAHQVRLQRMTGPELDSTQS